jgi:hypothetical protein
MAGLVPAIHVFNRGQNMTWHPRYEDADLEGSKAFQKF